MKQERTKKSCTPTYRIQEFNVHESVEMLICHEIFQNLTTNTEKKITDLKKFLWTTTRTEWKKKFQQTNQPNKFFWLFALRVSPVLLSTVAHRRPNYICMYFVELDVYVNCVWFSRIFSQCIFIHKRSYHSSVFGKTVSCDVFIFYIEIYILPTKFNWYELLMLDAIMINWHVYFWKNAYQNVLQLLNCIQFQIHMNKCMPMFLFDCLFISFIYCC